MRIGLSTDISTRDGTTDKDAKMVNTFVDDGNVFKRPSAQGGISVGTGTAQGGLNGVFFYGDTAHVVTSGTTWNSGTAYSIGDHVSVDFVDYWALTDNTNSQPPSADWSQDYVPPIYVTTYATWDTANSDASLVYSNGDLTFSDPSDNNVRAISTIGKSSGKWYWELTRNAVSIAQDSIFGIGLNVGGTGFECGMTPESYGFSAWDGGDPNGLRNWNDAIATAYGTAWTTEVIGVLLNMDSGELSFTVNGSSQGLAASGLSGTFYAMATFDVGGAGKTITANFGATAFAYSVPSGYNSGLYA